MDAAAVTVETAPDSGYRLRNEVTTNVDPNAPEFARNVLAEVVVTRLVAELQRARPPGRAVQLDFSNMTRNRMTMAALFVPTWAI